MSDLVILGTDTDAGKTTLALLWLSTFADQYDYWKPVETGPSDTDKVRELVPAAVIHPPMRRLRQAVAPSLAARSEGTTIPSAADIAAARPTPRPGHELLIETFGSPLSPLNDSELQVELLIALRVSLLLASPSSVGAIGRTLQSLQALQAYALCPRGVVLLGAPDPFAVEEIGKHWRAGPVFSLRPPELWTVNGVHQAAAEQRSVLDAIRSLVSREPETSAQEAGALRSEALAPGSRLNEIVARDRQAIWHPYTSLRDPDAPLVVVSAQDEFLTLADGRRIIDGISSWWTILHGHRQPVLMRALAQAAETFDHVLFAGATHPWAVELAELLLATLPWQGGRVFYSDNGSTAVEVALKMAYQFWCHQNEPQRTLFIGFEHGYHGDTFGAMAASRDPVFFGRFEPLLFRCQIVPVSAERLEEMLKQHPGQVAAVILEPLVQGAGGMRMHSAAQLRAIAETAQQHNVLLIVDEVMTGGGRLGPLWAHQEAGIVPDLICAAKTLAGGVLSLAATLAAPHIVAAFDTADRSKTFFHGHSFTAHPLACAVAVANWKLMPQVVPAAPRRMEAFWREALAPLRNHPKVRQVRIKGSIAAVELAGESGYLADVGRQLRRHCLERGVLLRPLGNVLYALPPLGTSQTSLEQIAAAMISAVDSLAPV
jgi:adenosylmethionine-8-amino-7-oxononanoate aminotransferase